jgi:hypothetical protein
MFLLNITIKKKQVVHIHAPSNSVEKSKRNLPFAPNATPNYFGFLGFWWHYWAAVKNKKRE